MHKLSLIMICLACILLSSVGRAEDFSYVDDGQELNEIISTHVAESYDFSGMALYLNQVSFMAYSQGKLRKIANDASVSESATIEKLIVVGRFKAMVVELNKSDLKIKNNQLVINNYSSVQSINVYKKNELAVLNPELKSIRYHHLWWPLAQLSIFFESMLVFLGTMVNLHWGLAIFIFAVLIKVVFFPLSIITHKVQAKVNETQGLLDPELNSIKARFDGEQAHLKIMAAHKKLGVSPFYTMKPFLMTLIQIPFLIAIFNALGEMSELRGTGFFWVKDLSLPDMLFNLGIGVPMFGEWFNLMPFLMAGVSVLATVKFGAASMSEKALKNQRIRLYLMALVFFILFYPFPAAMVFYWALANALQLIQQKILGP